MFDAGLEAVVTTKGGRGRSVEGIDRFDLAIRELDARPGDRILEIGCGSGEALLRLSLQAPGLDLTGLDRSQVAIRRAGARLARRNPGGRVALIEGELPGAGGPRGLDRIFAINVNRFWTGPDGLFDDVLSRLRPNGLLLLVYEAPGAEKAAEIRKKLLAATRRPDLRLDEPAVGSDPRQLCIKGVRAP